MAKIHGMMDIGRRGMALNQTAIQTTSHNMANKSTEGYSRQRVDVKTNPAIGQGSHQMGTGARIAGITRINNPWIEKQLERENSNFAHIDQKSQGLARLETALNEQSVKRLNDGIGNFFNSFRELANTPESAVARTQVREAGISLIKNFQDAHRQISDVKIDMNKNIEYAITEVNQYAKDIANLNEKIQRIEINGAEAANDERDERDALIKKLSEKLDVNYAEDAKTGMINVSVGRAAVLVAGSTSTELKTSEVADGRVRIFHEMSKGGANIDITDQFKHGKIGASIEVRDTTTQTMLDNLEQLAYGISSEVNSAHAEGYDSYNGLGQSFFEVENHTQPFSISNMKISSNILKDVGFIAAAARPDAPGDNTVANLIHNLQSRRMMDDGKYSYDDYYNAKVSEIGLLAQRSNSTAESQKQTLEQLQNLRESISGVSMDEEAAKLIEFQKSYEASARLIRTADEMFDTVLNLKRL